VTLSVSFCFISMLKSLILVVATYFCKAERDPCFSRLGFYATLDLDLPSPGTGF
jgi:hypothetical protein